MSGSDKTNLGDRMKDYERVTEIFLPKRIPVIIRIDGRAFHTYTKKHFGKKYSEDFTLNMIETAKEVVKAVQGCNLAYCQSDEINLLLTDYKTVDTQPWFNYNLRKICSISASVATAAFNKYSKEPVQFDSRAFSVPQDDVCNYFIWRQQDAIRNSTQMLGYEHYSAKKLHKVSCKEMRIMLAGQGIHFDKLPLIRQRGFCINKEGVVDAKIPIFSEERAYVDKAIFVRED
jgi:tRNA(His) 5'-end guanylyltransferase